MKRPAPTIIRKRSYMHYLDSGKVYIEDACDKDRVQKLLVASHKAREPPAASAAASFDTEDPWTEGSWAEHTLAISAAAHFASS